jgi:hypothetical protein
LNEVNEICCVGDVASTVWGAGIFPIDVNS